MPGRLVVCVLGAVTAWVPGDNGAMEAGAIEWMMQLALLPLALCGV